MFKAIDTQGILSKYLVDDDLKSWFKAFLIDRKAQGTSYTSDDIDQSSELPKNSHTIVNSFVSTIDID